MLTRTTFLASTFLASTFLPSTVPPSTFLASTFLPSTVPPSLSRPWAVRLCRLTRLALVALLGGFVAAGFAACGHQDHDHPVESPDGEACEHLQEGPAVAVAAAATFGPGAPKIADDHKRYDLTLTDLAGGKIGHVTFASAQAGEYIFFTNAAVTLHVASAAMVDVPAEAAVAPAPACSDIKGRHVFDLQVGTYVLSVSSPSVATVSLVVEANQAH